MKHFLLSILIGASLAKDCPNPCSDDEIFCNYGDECNNDITLVCLPKSYPSPNTWDFKDVECPIFCHVNECPENEMLCYGGTHESDGCRGPDSCQPTTVLSITESDLQCGNVCPVSCGADELFCSGGFDSQGCPMTDYCQPAIYYGGMFYDVECPGSCPPVCAPGETLCYATYDYDNPCNLPYCAETCDY